MVREEKWEIRRQGMPADLFLTGVNAVSMEGTLHLSLIHIFRRPEGGSGVRRQEDGGRCSGGRSVPVQQLSLIHI